MFGLILDIDGLLDLVFESCWVSILIFVVFKLGSFISNIVFLFALDFRIFRKNFILLFVRN